MLYLSFSKIVWLLIPKLRIANNLSKNLLTSVDVIKKDEIVGEGTTSKVIQILFKFQKP